MEKKIFRRALFLAGIVGIVSTLGAGCSSTSTVPDRTNMALSTLSTSSAIIVTEATPSAEQPIRTLITTFGSKIKNVDQKAVKREDLRNQITDNYKGLISDALYSSWEANPALAPGRPASSPWPEQIEVSGISQTKPVISEAYEIQADLVWLTSQGESSKEPIIIRVVKEHDQWVIDDYRIASQIPSSTVIHTDAM
jgi:hypothetical protein